jgi:hypothetical protein
MAYDLEVRNFQSRTSISIQCISIHFARMLINFYLTQSNVYLPTSRPAYLSAGLEPIITGKKLLYG